MFLFATAPCVVNFLNTEWEDISINMWAYACLSRRILLYATEVVIEADFEIRLGIIPHPRIPI
jgi:hypothetical protein